MNYYPKHSNTESAPKRYLLARGAAVLAISAASYVPAVHAADALEHGIAGLAQLRTEQHTVPNDPLGLETTVTVTELPPPPAISEQDLMQKLIRDIQAVPSPNGN